MRTSKNITNQGKPKKKMRKKKMTVYLLIEKRRVLVRFFGQTGRFPTFFFRFFFFFVSPPTPARAVAVDETRCIYMRISAEWHCCTVIVFDVRRHTLHPGDSFCWRPRTTFLLSIFRGLYTTSTFFLNPAKICFPHNTCSSLITIW